MNKYKAYQEYLEFLDIALTLDEDLIKEYYEKQDSAKKHYLYTKLASQLSNILKTKEDDMPTENKEIKVNYSDDDIKFLKQFSAFDLTLREACLTGKREEYWFYSRSIFSSIKNDEFIKIKEDLDKLNGDYTPRLVLQSYLKHSKKK